RQRPHVEALGDDPGRFWELDVEVSVAKVARAAAKLLRAGKVEPNFPDWSALALDSEPVPDGMNGSGRDRLRSRLRTSSSGLEPSSIVVDVPAALDQPVVILEPVDHVDVPAAGIREHQKLPMR